MLATGSATEVAFTMIALLQAAFACVWSIGAIAVPGSRHAIAHWAVWAALSAVTWLILAINLHSPPLLGVCLGIVAVIALHRGIRLFIGRKPRERFHLGLLFAVVVAYVIGERTASAAFTTFISFGMLAGLYLTIGRDLYLHARVQFRSKWSGLLALPVLLGCAAYGTRALRALVDPDSVTTQMAADSALNVRAALIFVVLVVAFHATLMVLVAGRLTSELRRLSRYDGLTGLLNRRAMEEILAAQVKRSTRNRESFVLMMLDLDHFKHINDAHGHAVGDLALRHASDLLANALNDGMTLARFGGEEFVLVMRHATLPEAVVLAEQLRLLLHSTPLIAEAARPVLSVSIGVAQWRATDGDVSQLLLRADAALFKAKTQGRNRVVLDAP